MNEIDKSIKQFSQKLKSDEKLDANLEEELSNTMKFYFENQKEIEKSIEQNFIKQIVDDENYDHFDFEYLIPLPQKITKEWVKSKLEFSNSEIIVMHRTKQDGFYILKTYFYFIAEGQKFLVSALIHKNNVIKFESDY